MNNGRVKSFSFFLEHLKKIQRQHWFFLITMGGVSVIYPQTGNGLLNLWSLLWLAGVSTYFYSLVYRWIENSQAQVEARLRWLRWAATGQVLLDLVFITAAIHYSGGPLSPVPLVYLLYLWVLTIVFSPRQLVFLSLMATLLHLSLLAGYWGGLESPTFSILWSPLQVSPPLVARLMVFYATALLFNGLLLVYHAHKLEQDRQAAESQHTYLDRLQGLTRLGLERMELGELHQILAEEIKPVLAADFIYLTRWDQDEKKKPEANRAGASLAASKYEMTLTKSVWWAGKPLIAEDVLCSPYLSVKSTRAYQARSLLTLPLYGLPDHRFLGALLVGYQTRHSFSPAEITRAQQVADVAALLISRTRLYDETQRRAGLLEQMVEQVSRLTSDLRKTTLLPAIVKSARELLDAERAALHLLDQSGGKLHCEFSQGLSEPYLEHMAAHFGASPEGLILQAQNYVLVPDVNRDSRTSPVQGLISREKFRAYAVFSIAAADGTLGILSLYWDKPRAISSEEVTVGCLFAQRAGALVNNMRLYEQVAEESLTDSLTGLPNRRFLDQRLLDETQRSSRYHHSYVLVMIDLDGFKAINDSFGHPIGDSVLRQVAESFQRVLRATDLLMRYGGDEFAIILPETDLDEVDFVLEKLRAVLAATSLHLPNETQRYISACMGAAIYPVDAETGEELLRIADQRMYAAKRQGHGMVVSRD